MGLLHSLPLTWALDCWRPRVPERLRADEGEYEDGLIDPGATGGHALRQSSIVLAEPAAGQGDAYVGAPPVKKERKDQVRPNVDRGQSLHPWLPQVDTDDAVRIWCGHSQPRTGTVSAWMKADEERSTTASDDDEYELEKEEENDEENDEEDEEDEETSCSQTATSSCSDPSVTSEMLRRWRRMRRLYANNPEVAADILVNRVLMYMGYPHWRKMDLHCSAEGDSRTLRLQTIMALRLEEFRQKRRQLLAAWKALNHGPDPMTRVVFAAHRQDALKLEKEIISLRLTIWKLASAKVDSAKGEQPTMKKEAAAPPQVP